MSENVSTVSYHDYKDKVLAGWLGKSLGGVLGAALECHKELKDLSLEAIWPEKMIPNDDLDLQVVWLEAMQERGLFLSSEDLADFWQDRCWYFFCEYGVFLNNIQRGIAPPLSGTWNNRFFKNSEGCPIRADIWGFVAPNNPMLAAELARLDGQLDHGEISIQTEQFLAAAASHSIVSRDLDEALAAGLSVIPKDSPIALAVPRVRAIADRYKNPRQAWRVLIREFGSRNANDAITNHAITLLALFLGKGDFKQTMLFCANFGWDTDCTASTAGALLGSLGGTAVLPPDWIEKLGKTLLCGIEVKHKDTLLSDFAEDTCRIGVEMAAVRNPRICFSQAPEVVIRQAPAGRISLEIIYEGAPVLWSKKATDLRLRIKNPFPEKQPGLLRLEMAEGLSCQPPAEGLVLPAEGEIDISLRIERIAHAGEWLRDQNLCKAIWTAEGHAPVERVFGLGGARQWQAYGPYWDMWDKTKNAICPYNNEQMVAGPFMADLMGDCYNQYAELEHRYLDEEALLKSDLPEEMPLLVERGEDWLGAEHLGGFTGQACYYLVRTLRARVPGTETTLVMGRSGPYRMWLDGVELGSGKDMRGWSSLDNTNHKIVLTGKPQRLVIKLVRLTDAFEFSLQFMCRGDLPRKLRGISNILDSLEDSVPVGE